LIKYGIVGLRKPLILKDPTDICDHREYSFHKDTEKVLHIPYNENEEQKAELEISEGKVRMLPMSRDVCPRGICSEKGWISRGHQSIVCLPNKIVITMRTSTAEKEHYENKKIDGITY